MPATPVFVDSSGRRGRWIRRLFWALGVLVSAYVAVVFVSLIGPPSLSRLTVPGLGPVLPGSGPPGLRTATGQHAKPAAVLPRRPSPSPQAGDGSAPAGGSTPTLVPTSAPTSAATAGSSPVPVPSRTPTSAPTTAATGKPVSPGPRSSSTPPGQASTRPSPRSSHAHGGSPQPSPTP